MSDQTRQYVGGNAILDLLTATKSEESTSLLATAAVVGFRAGELLLDTNQVIEHVYFPIDMMVSTTTLMHFGSEVAVDSIGREGMSGAQVVFGADRVPGTIICQVSGSAACFPAHAFVQHIERSVASSEVLRRYIQATMDGLEISIACNALHTLSHRCARWLLITHDRVGRDEFELTQDFLAKMLGARRSTVNPVSQHLQDRGAIRYAKGVVQISDRSLLEDASCKCYTLGIDRYNELLRQPAFGRANNFAKVAALAR